MDPSTQRVRRPRPYQKGYPREGDAGPQIACHFTAKKDLPDHDYGDASVVPRCGRSRREAGKGGR